MEEWGSVGLVRGCPVPRKELIEFTGAIEWSEHHGNLQLWDSGAGHGGWQKERPGWQDYQREEIPSSALIRFSLIQYLLSFIFSNEWDIWKWRDIKQNSPLILLLLPRFIPLYTLLQPPWDIEVLAPPCSRISAWGSAGGAQACFFNFLKLEMSFIFLWWLILHLYLKWWWLLLGGDCYYHSFMSQ